MSSRPIQVSMREDNILPFCSRDQCANRSFVPSPDRSQLYGSNSIRGGLGTPSVSFSITYEKGCPRMNCPKGCLQMFADDHHHPRPAASNAIDMLRRPLQLNCKDQL